MYYSVIQELISSAASRNERDSRHLNVRILNPFKTSWILPNLSAPMLVPTMCNGVISHGATV
jgi:hypothetical protein